MTHSDNRLWSDRILRVVDSAFRHRWEVWEEELMSRLGSSTVWIDCGCGHNELVRKCANRCQSATGIDRLDDNGQDPHYVKADISSLPFPDQSADLVTLRFVVEHFDAPSRYLNEISRVLKPGGVLMIMTTNIRSPLIFIPKWLFPFALRQKLLTMLFKVQSEDVFPTYHRLNSMRALSKAPDSLNLSAVKYLSDLNYTRRWIFLLLLLWHSLTRVKFFRRLRTNLFAIYEKQK